jgi:hypothetical protein
MMHVGSVLELAQCGRGNRRPDTEPSICSKNPSRDQNQLQMTTTSAGETMQAPFNESEWAVSALFHLLEHPNLRHCIKTLLMDNLLGGLTKSLNTHGRPKSHRRTSGRKINSSHKQSTLFDMAEFSSPIVLLVDPLEFCVQSPFGSFFCRNCQARGKPKES